MKNSSDTIEIRTRDLPACGTVPQPTAPQRNPTIVVFASHRLQLLFIKHRSFSCCLLVNRNVEADIWDLGDVWWKGIAPPLVHHYRWSHNSIIYCICKCIHTENTARKNHLQNVGLQIWRKWCVIPCLHLEIIPLYTDYYLVRCDFMWSVDTHCYLLPPCSDPLLTISLAVYNSVT
jgi:hypothetical protein